MIVRKPSCPYGSHPRARLNTSAIIMIHMMQTACLSWHSPHQEGRVGREQKLLFTLHGGDALDEVDMLAAQVRVEMDIKHHGLLVPSGRLSQSCIKVLLSC